MFGGPSGSMRTGRVIPTMTASFFPKATHHPFLRLWAAAGKVTEEELMTMRNFGSPLEATHHVFPYTEASTGFPGQGLSVGLGMALNAKYIDKLPYRTYVLLGTARWLRVPMGGAGDRLIL